MDLKAKFTQAIAAIELIEEMHPGMKVKLVPAEESSETLVEQKVFNDIDRKVAFSGSKRDRVKAVTREAHMTIDEIVNATGMTKGQVRGAVNAPDIREFYDRIDLSDGRMKYKYIGDQAGSRKAKKGGREMRILILVVLIIISMGQPSSQKATPTDKNRNGMFAGALALERHQRVGC